jgi:hypothetical protein
MAPVEDDGAELLLRRVRKFFTGKGWFCGTVSRVRKVLVSGDGAAGGGSGGGGAPYAVRVWTVSYDDGDEEEFTTEELTRFLQPLAAGAGGAAAAGGGGSAAAPPPAGAPPAAGKGARAHTPAACLCTHAGQRAARRGARARPCACQSVP